MEQVKQYFGGSVCLKLMSACAEHTTHVSFKVDMHVESHALTCGGKAVNVKV